MCQHPQIILSILLQYVRPLDSFLMLSPPFNPGLNIFNLGLNLRLLQKLMNRLRSHPEKLGSFALIASRYFQRFEY